MMNSIQILKKQLRNQRGDALMVAVVMMSISLISSLAMMNYSKQISEGTRRPRVKALMTSLEAKIRSELMTPSTYVGCTTEFQNGGRESCTLIEKKVTDLSRTLPESQCPEHGVPCGIKVTVESFDKTTSRAIVRIRYEGTDLNLMDIVVTQDVPADILQSAGIYQCPETAPKFNGFLANGQIDCVGELTRANVNEFVGSIDPVTLKTSTMVLPSIAACSSDQYVNYVNWGDGGKTFTYTCAKRLEPFQAFGFTPKVAPGGNVVYVVNPD